MPFTPHKPPLSRPQTNLPGFVLPAVLPDDIASLKALLHAQQAAVKITVDAAVSAAVSVAVEAAVEATTAQIRREAQETIARMIEQMVLARHRQFGASTEQLPAQARLFDEAETLAQSSTDAQDIAPIPAVNAPAHAGSDQPSKKAARGKRRPLPADLPRVDVIHAVPQEQRTCPCGTPMVEIGEDVSEQLDIVPMQVRVLRPVAL